VIRHTATDIETVNGIVIEANVSDDVGIKGAVNLYYSEQRPSDPPDLGSMILLPMELESGTAIDGDWKATIPNPLADAPAGTETSLFYVIVADDNDDKGGKCDHSSIRSFEMQVINAGGTGGLGLCEPCTTDRQCGGDDDLCLSLG